MRNRGGFNRRTGKTTPRSKVKTHWGKSGGSSASLGKRGTPAASGAKKSTP